MRPLFYRHYRPLSPLKSPLVSSNPNQILFSLSFFNLKLSLSIIYFSYGNRFSIFWKFSVVKMVQKTEKEETEFKVVPETITPCVNNCGVTGNPATNNMCQNCFNAATTAASSVAGSTVPIPHKFAEKSPRSTFRRSSPGKAVPDLKKREVTTDKSDEKTGEPAKREVNRCSGCRRKVGLTGFRCRCGEIFCGEHRYSDRHDCSYDYKTAGREAIARENPVVRAAKIFKL